MAIAYLLYLARWAKWRSWKETSDIFKTSWDRIFQAVKYVVFYGLAHRSLNNITVIGIDEISVYKGRKSLAMVYQLVAGVRLPLHCNPKARQKRRSASSGSSARRDVISSSHSQ